VQKKCINLKKCDIIRMKGGLFMLIEYQVKGYKTFFNEVNFSMEANNYIKKNSENIFSLENYSLLKSAIIYGPNNTGKSAFISSIKFLKDIVLEQKAIKDIVKNPTYFNFYCSDDDKSIDFYIKILVNNDTYEYFLSLKYLKGIVEEKLVFNNELVFDVNDLNSTKEEIRTLVEVYQSYHDKLIVSTLPKKYMVHTENIKSFFENIVIFQEDTLFEDGYKNFKMDGVYTFLNNSSGKERNLFNQFIQNADISIHKIVLENDEQDIDNDLKIKSIHKGNEKLVESYSVFSESDGSKRFMRYIAEFIKAFEVGKLILVDEIDNSLHTLLTKSILALFNNEENKNTQLITTSHDLLLLDTEYLFRKDQIWFVYKDEQEIYMYSLNDIKDNDGARNKTMNSYLKGMFGALPNPKIGDLFFERSKEKDS